METVVRRFIDDVKQILAETEASEVDLHALAERMGEFVCEPVIRNARAGLLDRAEGATMYRDVGRRSEVVYTDETGLTLVRSRFDPQEPTPIHSHGTWGVIGVYAGRDRHQSWSRRDSGTGAGHAEVEMLEQRILMPGDVELIPYPPQDIHVQQGDGEPAFEFVLFGKNAMVIPRLIFDPINQEAREVIPAQH